MKKSLGQINILALIGIGFTLASTAVGAFFYQSNRTAAVETKTAVLEEQHIADQRWKDNVDKKLDMLLGLQMKLIPAKK